MRLLRLLLLIEIAIGAIWAEDSLHVPVAFRHLGSYAGGLRRGHLYLPLNLSSVKEAYDNLERPIRQLQMVMKGELVKAVDFKFSNVSHPRSIIMMATLQETLVQMDETYVRFCTLIANPVSSEFSFSKRDRKWLERAASYDEWKTQSPDEKKEAVPQPRSKPTTISAYKAKRQVAEFVAVGLSLYNMYEIHELSGRVDSQARDIQILKHKVEETVLATNKVIDCVNKYRIMILENIEKVDVMYFELFRIELYLQVNSHLQKFINEMNLLVNGLSELFKGKLTPYVLNWPEIEAPLSLMHEVADKSHLRPLFSEWGWILNCPFSFLLDGEMLKLYLHVPYYSEKLYPLYQHINLPFVSKDFNENGISLVVESEKEYIAIDAKSKVGRTLSHKDFLRCYNFQLRNEKVYICDETSLLETDLDDTCLGSLFLGLFTWDKLEKVCDMKLAFPRAYYQVLNENQIAYFFPKETETRLDCSNSSHILIKAKVGLNYQRVDSHCKFSAPGIQFIPEINLERSAKPWLFFPREVPFTDLKFDWHAAEKTMHELTGMKPMEKISLEELERHQWNQLHHGTFWSTSIVVLVIVAVSFGLIGYFIWRKREVIRRQFFSPKIEQEMVPMGREQSDPPSLKDPRPYARAFLGASYRPDSQVQVELE